MWMYIVRIRCCTIYIIHKRHSTGRIDQGKFGWCSKVLYTLPRAVFAVRLAGQKKRGGGGKREREKGNEKKKK